MEGVGPRVHEFLKSSHLYGQFAVAAFFLQLSILAFSGLFFGIELVTNKDHKTPASEITSNIVNDMKDEGILLSKLGINYNTLKIRPPMTFSKQNTDFLLEKLDKVLKKNML